MKPRTKIEREVVSLSHKLGEIGKRDTAHIIRHTYGSCKYEEMYNRCYVVINQAYKGWQVLRYIRIDRHRNRAKEVSYTTWEVFQFWNKVGEKQILLARQRTLGPYIDTFSYPSKLEVRPNPTYVYEHFVNVSYTYLYNKSVEGAYRYAAGYMEEDRLYRWYRFLSCDKFAETIIKLRPKLAKHMIFNERCNKAYINAVRIAMRHNYEIINPSHYFDLIRMLVNLKCDLNNPHFVCPEDFEHTHQWAVEASMSEDERRRREAERTRQLHDMQKKEKQNADYINRCNRFFGVEITDGTISCHVLRSVAEFFEEGTAMHHCVYTNEYYAKKDSLILSARINDKRIETVEVDLQQMKVVQCYGACDKFTIYHDRIVSLVNDNMNMIKECMKTKQIAI